METTLVPYTRLGSDFSGPDYIHNGPTRYAVFPDKKKSRHKEIKSQADRGIGA